MFGSGYFCVSASQFGGLAKEYKHGLLLAGEGTGDTLAVVVACTIILSIFAHGLTAIPFATAFGKRVSRES